MSLVLAPVILLVLIVIGGGGIVVPAAASLGHSGSSGHNRPTGSGSPAPHSSYVSYSYGVLKPSKAACYGACPSQGHAYTRNSFYPPN
ncbi:hypothetical protein BS78_08G159400 [Paspalum vaginatum]|nr:hypothetical protein BS78_08G159400 [Paspalum vaginatum]